MGAKQEIERTIGKISGRYSAYEVFSDWIRCCAISISQAVTPIHDKIWHDREKLYADTASRYLPEEQEEFARMFVLLGDALTEDLTDVLGEIYMEMGMGSKTTGQFFTPFHLGELTARMGLDLEPAEGGKIHLNEPTCGGGAMIIAAAKILRDRGENYQKLLKVVAQDLDWKGVYMCYLQLSLLGIDAVIAQGDTLMEPYTGPGYPRERILRTPMNMGVLM